MHVEEHQKRGELFARSLFFGTISPEQGATISILCEEGGISIAQWLASYNIVHDRPAMKADAMLAEFLRHGGKVDILERSSDRAAARLQVEGGQAHDFALAWSEVENEPYAWVYDKQTRQKVRNPKYATPRSRMQMLWARMVSDAIRAIDPTVNSGLYTPEEVGDFPSPAAPEASPCEERREPPPVKVERPAPAVSSPAPTATAEEKKENPANPQPEVEQPQDYTVMPCGGSKGTPFAAMPLAHLEVALRSIGKVAALTEDYRPAIESAIAAAKSAA